LRLLLDEMWSPVIADQLRRRGYDVAAVAERTDLRSKSDDAIFAGALAEGRVVVTEDVAGFRPLADEEIASGRFHPGLVFASRRRFDTEGLMVRRLSSLLESDADLRNQERWLSSD
jgi:hypothetical protein